MELVTVARFVRRSMDRTRLLAFIRMILVMAAGCMSFFFNYFINISKLVMSLLSHLSILGDRLWIVEEVVDVHGMAILS